MKRATRLPARSGRLSAPSGRLSVPSGRRPALFGRRRARYGRVLALVGVVVGAALLLSACDASPYAASVDGQTISQLTLNTQLSQWASNTTWVSSFDSANSTAEGGSGVTVTGTGGQGTYSAAFVSDILSNLIQARIVHQHLVKTHNLPTADETTASLAVNAYLRSAYWNRFPASLRQFLVTQLAEEAVLTPISTSTSSLQSAYKEIAADLISRVCVREASAFSKSAAQAIVSSGTVGGTLVCYGQKDLEAQSKAFQKAVSSLSIGGVSSPLATSYGYQVIQLESRQTPGLSPGVKRVLSVATATTEPAKISTLISKAHVKVNPTYGTWSKGELTPPTAPSVAGS